jgi:hypothetical protein
MRVGITAIDVTGHAGIAGDRRQAGELHRPAQAGAHNVQQERLLLGLFGLDVKIDGTGGVFIDDRATHQSEGENDRDDARNARIPTLHRAPFTQLASYASGGSRPAGQGCSRILIPAAAAVRLVTSRRHESQTTANVSRPPDWTPDSTDGPASQRSDRHRSTACI